MVLLRHRVRRATVAAVVGVGITVSACSTGGHDRAGDTKTIGADKSIAQVCEAAKAEGDLEYRDTTDPALFAKEIAGFKKKYPWIKVHFGSQRPQDVVQRIVTEKQARRSTEIDAIAPDMPSADPMIKAGLVQPVAWTKLGVPASDVLEVKNTEFLRTQRIMLGLGYNKDRMSAADLPDTWEQLVDSKWAGKVIVDPRGKYLSGLGIVWGEKKAVDWYKRFLATDKPMVVSGATTSVQKVISGEAELTTSSHDAEVIEQGKKGAPIGIKYLDVVPTQDHYVMVVKGAPHPNAAACFLSWWASPDGGQAAQLKYEFKANETRPKDLPPGAKLGAITSAKHAELQSTVADKFADLTDD